MSEPQSTTSPSSTNSEPRKRRKKRRKKRSSRGEDEDATKENVRVVVRFRPVNEKEFRRPDPPDDEEFSLLIDERQQIVGLRHATNKKKSISGARHEENHNFVYDKVFGPHTPQKQVFEEVAQDAISWITDGYHSTIFAYGQTGTGKTWTMFGPDGTSKDRGVIPRACEQLFHSIAENADVAEVNVKCSFLEIYKEVIRDLLRDPMGKEISLRVRNSADKGVYVQGLIEKYVYSPHDVLALIRQGEDLRTIGRTDMNAVSSRSHAVLAVTVTQTLKDGSVRIGKLNLVDLAGSENVSKSNVRGERLKEATKINKSLSALGNVIYSLTEARRDHVPYRDSKLTYLLQDSLGGNTKTVLIITCSPHQSNFAETLSSLKFGKRAKSIQNLPRINKQESVGQLKQVVAYLEDQLEKYKAKVTEMELILEVLGIEKDEEGHYIVPADGSRVQVSGRTAGGREARLLRRLERAERKLDKVQRHRVKEKAYYSQLKDLFNKQRELAKSLSKRLKRRDDTIVFLTRELDEYAQFQGTLEASATTNPEVLSQLMASFKSTSRAVEGDGYDDSDEDGQMPWESAPGSPVASDAEFSYADPSSSGVVLPVGGALMSKRNLLKGINVSESNQSLASNSSGGHEETPEEREERRRVLQAAADNKQAISILEGGAVFVKYPYGGFMAKKSDKQIFFDKKSRQLYYWSVNSKISDSSKSLDISNVTALYIGKKTTAFERNTAKDAVEQHCFSIEFVQDGDVRTLDFEAETRQARDAWVAAIYHVASHHRPAAEPVKRVGELPSKNPLRPNGDIVLQRSNSGDYSDDQDAMSNYSSGSRHRTPRVVHKADSALRMIAQRHEETAEEGDGMIYDDSSVSRSKEGASDSEDDSDMLPDFKFKRPKRVDPGDVNADDVRREMRTAKHDADRIMHKVGRLKTDPLGDPAGETPKGDEDEPKPRKKEKKKKKKKKERKKERKKPKKEEEEEEEVVQPETELPSADEEDEHGDTSTGEGLNDDDENEDKQDEVDDDDEAYEREEQARKREERAKAKRRPTSPRRRKLPPKKNSIVEDSEDAPKRRSGSKSPRARRGTSKSPKARGKGRGRGRGRGRGTGRRKPIRKRDASPEDTEEEEQASSPSGGFKVKALYNFEAKSRLQLSFKKGQVITVLAKKTGGWWDAQLGSEVGAIPYNYVKVIKD